MALLMTSSLPFSSGYDSPAWAEVDRLQSRKHLLTIRSSFRPVGGDKEREQRRKRRQWQHWQSAMDAAIAAVLQEEEIRKELELKAAVTSLVEAVKKQPPVLSFSSRSPTLFGETTELPKTFPLTKADLSYQFTFTCPTAPSWPLQKPAAAFTGEKQSRRCTSLTKRCCVGVTEEVEEHQVEAAFGRRLLARRSPAERATLRRRSLWRSQNRAVSL